MLNVPVVILNLNHRSRIHVKRFGYTMPITKLDRSTDTFQMTLSICVQPNLSYPGSAN